MDKQRVYRCRQCGQAVRLWPGDALPEGWVAFLPRHWGANTDWAIIRAAYECGECGPGLVPFRLLPLGPRGRLALGERTVVAWQARMAL